MDLFFSITRHTDNLFGKQKSQNCLELLNFQATGRKLRHTSLQNGVSVGCSGSLLEDVLPTEHTVYFLCFICAGVRGVDGFFRHWLVKKDA